MQNFDLEAGSSTLQFWFKAAYSALNCLTYFDWLEEEPEAILCQLSVLNPSLPMGFSPHFPSSSDQKDLSKQGFGLHLPACLAE